MLGLEEEDIVPQHAAHSTRVAVDKSALFVHIVCQSQGHSRLDDNLADISRDSFASASRICASSG